MIPGAKFTHSLIRSFSLPPLISFTLAPFSARSPFMFQGGCRSSSL